MDLKGAELKNFYHITDNIPSLSTQKDTPPKKVVIPHYQRPYKWEEEHIRKLIRDWKNNSALDSQNDDLANGDSSRYFAGSIVTVSHKDEACEERHDLIDGQQRFTTIFLINYIKFLLSRLLLREAIKENQQIHISGLFKSYLQAGKFLLLQENELNFNQSINQLEESVINAICDSDNAPQSALTIFKEGSYLPLILEDDPKYAADHHTKLEKLFQRYNFVLQYDRQSFNESLKKVLSRTLIEMSQESLPRLYFYPDPNSKDWDDNEKTYVNAIRAIFDAFVELNNEADQAREKADSLKSNASSYTKNIVKNIDLFLQNVELCLVQTGNADDAYTLFEVLNDRSLALDDLDLIKNLFYKQFVLTNRYDNAQKDTELRALDEQWVDTIFKQGLAETAKKLIAFLAIGYITGDTRLGYKQGKEYRRAVNQYLRQYDENNPYTLKAIQRDFNIFESCKILLESAGVNYRTKLEQDNAHKAMYNPDVSMPYRTLHLLLALDQHAVLIGLSSYILGYLKHCDAIDDFNPAKVSEKIKRYFQNEHAPSPINEQAKALWVIAMKSKDYKLPHKLAQILIEHNNLHSLTVVERNINQVVSDRALDDEFNEWLRTWSYSPSRAFKIRLLFAKCIPLNLNEEGKLTNPTPFSTHYTGEVTALHIDHMEPQKIDETKAECYFNHLERDVIINGLGNMMLLPSGENISKSNKPLYYLFEHLEGSGLNHHFLTKKTKTLLDAHSTQAKSGAIRVPNEIFFSKRKEWLIEIFNQAIDL